MSFSSNNPQVVATIANASPKDLQCSDTSLDGQTRPSTSLHSRVSSAESNTSQATSSSVTSSKSSSSRVSTLTYRTRQILSPRPSLYPMDASETTLENIITKKESKRARIKEAIKKTFRMSEMEEVKATGVEETEAQEDGSRKSEVNTRIVTCVHTCSKRTRSCKACGVKKSSLKGEPKEHTMSGVYCKCDACFCKASDGIMFSDEYLVPESQLFEEGSCNSTPEQCLEDSMTSSGRENIDISVNPTTTLNARQPDRKFEITCAKKEENNTVTESEREWSTVYCESPQLKASVVEAMTGTKPTCPSRNKKAVYASPQDASTATTQGNQEQMVHKFPLPATKAPQVATEKSLDPATTKEFDASESVRFIHGAVLFNDGAVIADNVLINSPTADSFLSMVTIFSKDPEHSPTGTDLTVFTESNEDQDQADSPPESPSPCGRTRSSSLKRLRPIFPPSNLQGPALETNTPIENDDQYVSDPRHKLRKLRRANSAAESLIISPLAIHQKTPCRVQSNTTLCNESTERGQHVNYHDTTHRICDPRRVEEQLKAANERLPVLLHGRDLNVLLRRAIAGHSHCHELLLATHNFMLDNVKTAESTRRSPWTLNERRLIRKAKVVLEVMVQMYMGEIPQQFVDHVCGYFFPTVEHKAVEHRLGRSSMNAAVHDLVERGKLDRNLADQMMLLVTADEEEETEVEKVVFEGRELYGPGGWICENSGEVTDRPHHVEVDDGWFTAKDVEKAFATPRELLDQNIWGPTPFELQELMHERGAGYIPKPQNKQVEEVRSKLMTRHERPKEDISELIAEREGKYRLREPADESEIGEQEVDGFADLKKELEALINARLKGRL